MTSTEENELTQAYQDLQGTVSPARLRKAFELVQTQAVRPYDTTESTCTCPDHMYRHVVCKHMTALRLKNATVTSPTLPASPAEVSPDTGLAELRRIRAHWLATAERNGDLDTLFTVMNEYGVLTTAKTWTYRDGNISATLTITGWRASDYTFLTVEVAGKVVCQDARPNQARYANSQTPARLFIPGPWMNHFRKLASALQQREIHQRLTEYETERQKLLRELGIQ